MKALRAISLIKEVLGSINMVDGEARVDYDPRRELKRT